MELKSKRARKTSATRSKRRQIKSSAGSTGSNKLRVHMPAVIAFGLALQELRQRKRFSLESVASRVDLDVRELAEIERGTREPNLVLLFKLAVALDVEPSDLIVRMERKLQ